MKKIMFNDKYGLTQSVLEGRKTMTRRIIKLDKLGEYNFDNALKHEWGKKSIQAFIDNDARYKVGEVVAIAQSYKDAGFVPNTPQKWTDKGTFVFRDCPISQLSGWNNKLFVFAALMPNRIRITGVKIERLQDISDEDCLKEGIVQMFDADGTARYRIPCEKHTFAYATYSAKDAYHFLIDKVCDKTAWKSNPYVFVYEFELVD